MDNEYFEFTLIGSDAATGKYREIDVIDDVIAIVLGPENGDKVTLLIEHEGDMVSTFPMVW